MPDQSDDTTNRRRLLGALGTAGAALTTGFTTRNTIDFKHVCSGTADYHVRVSGRIFKTDNVEADSHDVIQNNRQVAKGGLGPERGRDTYRYTGEITHLAVNGPVVVERDGTRLHEPACLQDGGGQKVQTKQSDTSGDECNEGCGDRQCPLDNGLQFSGVPQTSGTVTIVVEVDPAHGVIEDTRNGQRFTRCELETTAEYLRRTGVTFRYAGELTCLSIEGPARVSIDQSAPCDGGGK